MTFVLLRFLKEWILFWSLKLCYIIYLNGDLNVYLKKILKMLLFSNINVGDRHVDDFLNINFTFNEFCSIYSVTKNILSTDLD